MPDDDAVAVIELNDVSLRRGAKYILNHINWAVAYNENWVLFGRNGSGKTMLLELISGYIYPSDGTIRRFGSGYGEGISIEEIRRKIGYVSTPLKNMFNVRERIIDVVISGLYAGIGLWFEPIAEDRERAFTLLETIHMEDRAGDQFGILSDGEKQKVLMLRALITEPHLLLLDEPVQALDIPSRESVLETIEQAHEIYHTSIIYVTHHTEEILPHFTNILILDRGNVFFKGTVKKGLNGKRLQELFEQPVDILTIKNRYYTVISD